MAQTTDIATTYLKANEALLSGNYSLAITEFQDVYNRVSNKQYKVMAVQGLSTSFIRVGQYKEAESLLLNTLNSFEDGSEQKSSSYHRELLNSISLVYYELHNYNKANSYIQEAKNLFEENLDFGEGYVRCLSLMSAIQAELGYKTLARMLIDVAVRQARTNYENLYYKTVEPSDRLLSDQAQSDLHKYKVVQYAQILSNAAATYNRMGYVGDAVSLIKEAIEISSSIGVELAYCYGNLAGFYLDKSNYREAIANYDKAIALATSPSAFDEFSMCLSLAKMLAGNKDVADVTLKNSEILKSHQQYAFTFLSENERQNYWENSGHNISLQNYIYQQRGNEKFNGAIYNNQLYSKGLLLRTTNDIYDKIFESGNSEMMSLYRIMLKTRISIINENNDVVIKKLQQRCDSIEKVLIRFCGLQDGNCLDIKWQDVQAKLKDKDIAIEFYCIPNIIIAESYADCKKNGTIYCAATLKKGYKTPHILQLLTSDELDKLLKEAPYGSVDLYNKIWKPLETELIGIENIYFSADRELHKVALESLIDKNHRAANSLWNMYRLSSTRELVSLRAKSQRKHYALFGGLNYSAGLSDIEESLNRNGLKSAVSVLNRADSTSLYRAGMRYLPGTKIEVESIESELQQSEGVSCDLYTGADGSEELLKSLSGSDINVIHLATHGYYWTKSEADERKRMSSLIENKDKSTSALLRSGILMSGANHALRGEIIPNNLEDGIATAQELSSLNYHNVDMVVLSACQSALGDINGEGVYGLQRGLKLAGVRSLLMTLWPVNDQATQMLMVEFYKNLIKGDSKVEALKKAQDYIKSQPTYESPKYWAGFILLDALN